MKILKPYTTKMDLIVIHGIEMCRHWIEYFVVLTVSCVDEEWYRIQIREEFGSLELT
jgi:hypothetical protein